MAHHISIVASIQDGQHGWLLRWCEAGDGPPRSVDVKLSHWFPDVDEAMAVRIAMRAGQTFEAAHAALWAGHLNLDTVREARLQREATVRAASVERNREFRKKQKEGEA